MTLLGNTHLVAGGAESIPAVLGLVEKEGIPTKGNPDVYVRSHQSFGIEEARELRARASARALSGKRVFVIATPSMTSEAQNALLKTLEEPSGEALFFFIVPSPERLLSTLRSRSQILTLGSTPEKISLVDAKEFLASSPEERLDMLSPLLEKGDDDKRDMSEILTFLSSLERTLGSARSLSGEGLHALYRTRRYIADRGALVKPLLEQLALLTPKV